MSSAAPSPEPRAFTATVAATLAPATWTVLGALGRMLAALARAAHRHRVGLAAIVGRGVFWGALVSWCAAAVALVGGAAIDVDATMTRFVLGAAACAVITVSASAGRLRWCSALLGALHGMGVLVLWLVTR